MPSAKEPTIAQRRRRIATIKKMLAGLGEMRTGTLSEQYNVCGKTGCRCKDAEHPQRHGPYFQLSYTHRGRSRTEFVRKDMLEQVRAQTANYATFKQLTDEWVALSIEIARALREQHHA